MRTVWRTQEAAVTLTESQIQCRVLRIRYVAAGSREDGQMEE